MMVVFKQIDFLPETQRHKTYFVGVDSFQWHITGTFHLRHGHFGVGRSSCFQVVRVNGFVHSSVQAWSSAPTYPNEFNTFSHVLISSTQLILQNHVTRSSGLAMDFFKEVHKDVHHKVTYTVFLLSKVNQASLLIKRMFPGH